MKMNAEGKKLYDVWYANYCKENDKLGGNSANGDFVEGWAIIDNADYVKTLEDFCGLMLFGYDNDAVWMVENWIEMYGNDEIIVNGYTCEDVRKELIKYFEQTDFTSANFIDDEEKMKDFYELTKEEFLASYSYLTEEEYDNTARLAN